MTTDLLDALAFYRPLGFFADAAGKTDEELAAELEFHHRVTLHANGDDEIAVPDLIAPGPKRSGPADWENGVPAEAHPEVGFLALDTSRVWWEDIETEFEAGNDDFVRLVKQWSAISRGAFVPTNIQEHWSETDRMYLEFESGGETHRLVPWAEEPAEGAQGFGYIDLELLNTLNEILGSTGYGFYFHEPFDQTAYVLVLTEEEATKMIEERGWLFAGEWE